ncbi:helix-turn-helix transcriptional regulator [Saccharomonospora xinjiangensis]|uniref:Putative transcriptional regulator n=1 Tax=Saccharomonospora xinjiangensis XJ-54 TaxID=882086 RepID=I0V3G3_9PSEU|nr:WYL domain-containing protein [Saccharomonospora xinjiangensis]EID54666.1 putative transcriptional regulator [Saccharomonospora xinjiangensis XJ-54]
MRAERLVALLFTLQSRRSATVAELAEALDVSPRTMHRDLAALQAAGVPLWTEPGRYGGVRLVEGWRTRLDGLTTREAVALFAMGAPRALAELGLGTAAAGAHAKVTATLPAPLREQARQVAQRFHLDAPRWFRPDEDTAHLADVARAVWEETRLRVRYRPGGASEEVERTLDPLGLVLKAGVWYLVAQAGESIRTYRVARITAVEHRPERADRPDDFDLADWWEHSSARFERTLRRVPVRIRLSPAGVRALPSVLDADLVAEALKNARRGQDGSAEAVVEFEAADVAVGSLLALGTEVEVLEPASVRADFAEVGRRIAERHGG